MEEGDRPTSQSGRPLRMAEVQRNRSTQERSRPHRANAGLADGDAVGTAGGSALQSVMQRAWPRALQSVTLWARAKTLRDFFNAPALDLTQ
jgi:hypothetical protein